MYESLKSSLDLRGTCQKRVFQNSQNFGLELIRFHSSSWLQITLRTSSIASSNVLSTNLIGMVNFSELGGAGGVRLGRGVLWWLLLSPTWRMLPLFWNDFCGGGVSENKLLGDIKLMMEGECIILMELMWQKRIPPSRRRRRTDVTGEICDFIGGWWFGGGHHFWVVYTQGAIERVIFLFGWLLHDCSFVSCSQSSNQSNHATMNEREGWLSLSGVFRSEVGTKFREDSNFGVVSFKYRAATWSRARSQSDVRLFVGRHQPDICVYVDYTQGLLQKLVVLLV